MSNAFANNNNFGDETVNLKEKYSTLKKKYISLLKDHKEVIKEYEKCNQELLETNEEKKFLRNKIEDLLRSKGFTIQDLIKEDQ